MYFRIHIEKHSVNIFVYMKSPHGTFKLSFCSDGEKSTNNDKLCMVVVSYSHSARHQMVDDVLEATEAFIIPIEITFRNISQCE